MIDRILLGYDGSASAADACALALDLATHYRAELHVLAVCRPPEVDELVDIGPILEDTIRFYEAILQPVRARVAATRLDGRFKVAVGHPAEELVRYAEEHRIDHIVVGHRGRTLFERWLIGSVARQVIAYAHCAVTVVRR